AKAESQEREIATRAERGGRAPNQRGEGSGSPAMRVQRRPDRGEDVPALPDVPQGGLAGEGGRDGLAGRGGVRGAAPRVEGRRPRPHPVAACGGDVLDAVPRGRGRPRAETR